MKLPKSTIILVNVVLVSLVAVLANFLIVQPRTASAGPAKEYSVVPYPWMGQSLEEMLNAKAKQGWTFVFAYQFGSPLSSLIFER
jgi:hypothetical protein